VPKKPDVYGIAPNSVKVNPAPDAPVAITIGGKNFRPTSVVMFGSTPAARVVDSTIQITALLPPKANADPNPLHVTVRNGNQVSDETEEDLFTYP
jgi:hypothetical protein